MANYITKFKTQADYNSQKYKLDYPNTSYIEGTDEVVLANDVPPYKLLFILNDKPNEGVECDSQNTIITSSDRPEGMNNSDVIGLKVGSCVTGIGEGAFQYLAHCTDFDFGSLNISEITSIPNNAFTSCGISGDFNTLFPNVVTVGNYAFQYSHITSVDLTGISTGTKSFSYLPYCSSLNTGSMTTIGENEFEFMSQSASGNVELTVSSSATQVNKGAFYYAGSTGNHTKLIFDTSNDMLLFDGVTTSSDGGIMRQSNIKEIYIDRPLSTRTGSIDNYSMYMAFLTNYSSKVNQRKNDSVTKVTFGPNSKVVPMDCCSYFRVLNDLTISEGVEYINTNAFNYCDVLSSATLPSTVKKIGNTVFWTSGVRSVTLLATTPPEITYNSFMWSSGNYMTIYVPAESVDAYKAAPVWSEYYTNYIQPIAE